MRPLQAMAQESPVLSKRSLRSLFAALSRKGEASSHTAVIVRAFSVRRIAMPVSSFGRWTVAQDASALFVVIATSRTFVWARRLPGVPDEQVS